MANAPGQLQGYALQLQRALLYLVSGGPGSSVCVEVLGDVGSLSSKEVIAEEDKSSITSNPVGNKSTDLWKTFYNWVRMVELGELDPAKTRFILYTNIKGKKAIVDKLSEVDSSETVDSALVEVKKILEDIDSQHSIYNHLSYLFDKKAIFKSIVLRFGFYVGSMTGSDEVKEELTKLVLPEQHIDHIHEELLGWVTNLVMERIANKKDPIIKWEEYRERSSVIFRRVRSRELIDFTTEYFSGDDIVKDELRKLPYYLQQLDVIGLDDEEKVVAVSDFLRSSINIDKWIEDELIDESMAQDFENKLLGYWRNAKRKISITNNDHSLEDRGKILYADCMSRQETIGNQHPPSPTVPGAFHNLANDDLLGWHESWKDIIKKHGG